MIFYFFSINYNLVFSKIGIFLINPAVILLNILTNGAETLFVLFNVSVMKPPFENHTQIILDSIADGVFTVNSDWKITSFNRAAGKITGIKKEEATGRYCWEVFKASICEKGCCLRRTMETEHPIINQHIFIVNSKGDRIPISISTAILKDKNDNVIGGVETFRDLSVVEQLRKELAKQHTFFDIISKNREMQRLFEMGADTLISLSSIFILPHMV